MLNNEPEKKVNKKEGEQETQSTNFDQLPDYFQDLYTAVKCGDKESLKTITDLSQEGNVNAQITLGNVYVFDDTTKAIKYYTMAAEQNSIDGINKLAEAYSIIGEKEKALEWFEKAGELGDLDTQIMLADMFFEGGDIADPDAEKAIYWYKKAAEQDEEIQEKLDDIEFQKELAEMFYDDKKIDKAIEWYEKAANQEDLESQIVVADLYYFGNYMDDRYGEYRLYNNTDSLKISKSIEWYEKIIQKNEYDFDTIDICFFLGDLYYYGNGVTQNIHKAINLYQKGIELDKKRFLSDVIPEVSYKIAEYYENNNDFLSAFKWFSKAADFYWKDEKKSIVKMAESASKFFNESSLDLKNAQEKLFNIISSCEFDIDIVWEYAKKFCKDEDYSSAFILAKFVAEKGYREGQYMLAKMYYYGKGTDINFNEAKNYFMLTACNNDFDTHISEEDESNFDALDFLKAHKNELNFTKSDLDKILDSDQDPKENDDNFLNQDNNNNNYNGRDDYYAEDDEENIDPYSDDYLYFAEHDYEELEDNDDDMDNIDEDEGNWNDIDEDDDIFDEFDE